MRLRKSVFFVAGFSARFLLAQKLIPIEGLPIEHKPLIHATPEWAAF